MVRAERIQSKQVLHSDVQKERATAYNTYPFKYRANVLRNFSTFGPTTNAQ